MFVDASTSLDEIGTDMDLTKVRTATLKSCLVAFSGLLIGFNVSQLRVKLSSSCVMNLP